MKLPILLLLISFNALSAPVGLQWDAPIEDINNEPLNGSLAGFNIYYGNSSGVWEGNEPINDPLKTSHTLDLPYGTHYFVMTAYDIYGQESVITPEVSVNILPPPPKPVTGFSVVSP